jgi:hypothetical protein
MLTPQHLSASLLATLAVAIVPPASSAATEETAGVEEARQALGRQGFPWYDKQTDAPRPVHVDVPWDLTSKSKSTWKPTLWGISFWEWVAIIVLTAALAALVWLLMRAYLNREETQAALDSPRVPQAAVDDKARIEALPFRIRRADIDLLDEARRLYEQGKYGEAMVYLFSYQLVEMDRHQVIRLAKGKTNRQYLRDLRRQPFLREIVERSMVAFEEVFFGGHILDRARFEAVWHELGQFTSFLTQQARA